MAVLRYFYTTPGLSKNVREALDDKVDKEEGMGLSQNDYTDTEKDKLEGVEDGAEVNVLADWNEQDTESDAYILNKPSVPILDPSGQIPASYLPSYVDDVLEYPTYSLLPLPGETGKIYVTTDTDLAYRWSGSTYVEISKSIITGVKGDAESNYRIGNVNLTATNIGLGNVVNLDLSKAIKSITRSGTTFTYTCLDGTTGTFTQQDNNTTYSAGTGLSLSNTTFSLALTKKLVTDALGYTPPTTDTNTTYSAGTGLSLSSTTFSVKYGTAAGTACQGNDSRLSNSRPASDVYSWAKASSKPSYSWSEITSKPCSFYSGTCSKTTYGSSNSVYYVPMSNADAKKVYSMEFMSNAHVLPLFVLYYYNLSGYPSNSWCTVINNTVGISSVTYRYIIA